MKEKGFVVLPFILGIIFIVLLGGLGLELTNVNVKISKGLKKVQELERAGQPREAVQKLRELKNSFLVKYFGIKEDEINKEVEKNLKLLRETEKNDGKAAKKTNEKVESGIVPVSDATTSILDCNDNLSCLVRSAGTCTLSKVKSKVNVSVGDYLPTLLLYGEIKGKQAGKCLFYIRAEKLLGFKFSPELVNKKLEKGLSVNEIKKEEENAEAKLRPFIEKKEELCLFRNKDLVKWLETIEQGLLPSFEGAECKYGDIEMLKNL